MRMYENEGDYEDHYSGETFVGVATTIAAAEKEAGKNREELIARRKSDAEKCGDKCDITLTAKKLDLKDVSLVESNRICSLHIDTGYDYDSCDYLWYTFEVDLIGS